MIYLASPYTSYKTTESQRKNERRKRFEQVCRVAGKLMEQGHYIYSPIVHGHPIGEMCNLPTDWKYWEGLCKDVIINCKKLIVLQLSGWELSTGVLAEIKIAQDFKLPVEYMEFKE